VVEDLYDGDEAALAGSADVDAAEAAYGDAESEAAALVPEVDAPEIEVAVEAAPVAEVEVDAETAPAAEVTEIDVAAEQEATAQTLEADEIALGGAPVVDDAEARFQAALDAMTAERDALADEPTDLVGPDADVPAEIVAHAEAEPAEAEPAEAEAEPVEEHGESTATSVGAAAAQARRRWVSEYDEVVDGGYGWGSAAPVWDGAMPLGHPVKANKQWMKFQEPADGWYDKMHADVWFVDADTARRFGFTKD
jgi:hypothetical protein